MGSWSSITLVPAVMQLLGDRNWWLPRWLDRIIPDGGLEGRAGAGARRLTGPGNTGGAGRV